MTIYGIIPEGIDWNDRKDEILEILNNDPGYLQSITLPIQEIDWSDKKDKIIEIAKKRFDFSFAAKLNIDWSDRKGEILDILKKSVSLTEIPKDGTDWSDKKQELFEEAKKVRNFSWLPTENIDWTDKKDEILSTIEELDDYYPLTRLLNNGIRWDEKDKDRILNIAKKSLRGLQLINGINWEDKKDEILALVSNVTELAYLPEVENGWNDKKDEILEIVKKFKSFNYFPEKGIDWTDKKDEILKLLKKNFTFLYFPTKNIDWTDKRHEILDISEDKKEYLSFKLKDINWSLSDIPRLLKLMHPLAYKNYIENCNKTNPIVNEYLLEKMEFQIGPFIRRDYNLTTERQKELLIDVMQNLERIGNNLQYGINDANEKFEKSFVDCKWDKDALLSRIQNIDKKDPNITILLAFYLNKLTKLHDESIYFYGLNDFKYNLEYDEILKNTPDTEKHLLDDNIKKYSKEKEFALRKADDIVRACIKLRGDKDKAASDNYAGIREKMEISENSTFYDFLQSTWKKDRIKNGELPYTNDVNWKDFYTKFNEEISKLLGKGYKLDEIEKIFLYTAKNKETVERAYRFKDRLISQILQHSKENSNILVAYKQGDDSKSHDSILYVYSDMFLTPFSFHIDATDFDAKNTIPVVKSNISSFCKNQEKNVACPITEEELEKVNANFSFIEFIERNERVLDKKNLRSFNPYVEKLEEYNEFIKLAAGRDILNIDYEIDRNPIVIKVDKENGTNEKSVDLELLRKFQERYKDDAKKYENDPEGFKIFLLNNPDKMIAYTCSVLMQNFGTLESYSELETKGILVEPPAKKVLPELKEALKKKRNESFDEYRHFTKPVNHIRTIFAEPLPEKTEETSKVDDKKQTVSSVENAMELLNLIPELILKQALEQRGIHIESEKVESVEDAKTNFITNGITSDSVAQVDSKMNAKLNDKETSKEKNEEQK